METPKLVDNEAGLARVEPQSQEVFWPRENYQAPATAPAEPTLLDYLRVLQKRKWVIAATVIVVVTLAAIASFRATPLYEATLRLAVYREGADIMGFQNMGSSSDDWDYTVALDTQARILQSDTLALKVIRALELEKSPYFEVQAAAEPAAEEAGVAPAAAQMDISQEGELLSIFRSSLRVSSIPKTRLIEIHYMSPDPRLSADVANNLASAYIEHNFKTKYESAMRASEWLSGQLADLKLKVEVSEAKLVDYQRTNDILGIDEKQNITTVKLDELNRQLTAAAGDRIQKEAQFRMASSGSAELALMLDSNPQMQRLRERQSNLEGQYSAMTTQFGPSYPKVVELKNQLAQVEGAIESEMKATVAKLGSEFRAAVDREKMLHAALEQQKIEANRLNEKSIQFGILKREAESNRQLYDNLLQKMKEAGVSAGLQSGNIRIVDPARPPLYPAKPNIPRNLAMSLLMGLFGGVALAFVLESLDSTIRTPEEVLAVSSIPALSVIPMNLRLNGKQKGVGNALVRRTELENIDMIAHTKPKSESAEAYRALRTSILLSALGAPPKVIMVTSALPQEGKTTTSLNTAIVLAQKGGRVLLVDADLRRPSVHRKLKMRAVSGLTNVLTGSARPQDVIIQSPDIPNLYVMPAGPSPPQPAELLGSSLMKQLLATWRQEYDHIVVDTPPALLVTDPVLLSPEADAVLLVVRAGETPKAALRRARNLLFSVNAKVLGAVVNAVDLRSGNYYNYYGYGYGYGSKHGGYYGDSTSE